MLLIAFFGGIYQTNLNTLGTTSLAKGLKELNINPGERLWYDSRYNCTDCDHRLRQDDLVMTYAGIGKIVALPDEVVAINVNKKDTNDHRLDSKLDNLSNKDDQGEGYSISSNALNQNDSATNDFKIFHET